MPRKTFGIDFGTGTVKVYKNNEGILLNERTVVAMTGQKAAKKSIAIGDSAYEMFEKVPPSIEVAFPMQNGAIARIQDMIALWNFMMNKISAGKKIKSSDFIIAVPADLREVDKNAFAKVVGTGECKPHKVSLIHKPIADAIGLNIDIDHARGVLIVNIGADTTEISVLSLGGVVVSKLLPYGGNYFDQQILQFVRKKYNYVIGRKTAEQIKKALVSTVPTDEALTVVGRDVLRGLPGEVTISSKEIYPLVSGVFGIISISIKSILERTPPEISSDIAERGIYLTGGSSWLNGLDQLIANETRYKVNTTRYAQKTVISGLGYLTEHPKKVTEYEIPFKLDK